MKKNLQELRWVLKDSAGMKLPPPAKNTIDLEGKLIKEGVRKAIRDQQNALHELLNVINSAPKAFSSAVDAPRIGLCARMRQMLFSFSCRTEW